MQVATALVRETAPHPVIVFVPVRKFTVPVGVFTPDVATVAVKVTEAPW